jgi:hypothetical protein
MKGMTGELLALAIDPDTPSTWATMKPAAKIRFEKPGRGHRSTVLIEGRIVHFMREQMKADPAPKLDMYVKAAETKFGLSRSRIHEIWRAYQKKLDDAGRAQERAWAKQASDLSRK